jgi:glycosyltransferase involved in cell wall biosynthesis
MTPTAPDISVVVPTYNRRQYLQKAVGSCFVGNGDIDVEVVVVDDGSTDDTHEYLKDIDDERVRPIFQGDRGGQVARNHGLDEARGTYVKFLDDDDWLKKGALVTEYRALKESGADVSYGAYEFIERDGSVAKREEASNVNDPTSALFTSHLLTHPLRFTYRRSLIEDLAWNPELPCRQDVAFILQVAARDPQFVRVDTPVGCLRRHDGERVGRTAGRRDDVDPPRIHANILLEAVDRMERNGVLSDRRKQAAARGLWDWAHLMAGRDLTFFRELYDHIQRLDPAFMPERKHTALSVFDAVFGPERTESMMYPLRKVREAVGTN